MRVWIGLLAVIVLGVAGCASSKPTKPLASATPQSMLEHAPSLSDDEAIEFLADAAVRKLSTICYERVTELSQMACLRESLLRGFDSTGEAARNCKNDASISATLRCVITGAVGYELALHENLAVADDYEWDDGRAALRLAAQQLRLKVLDDCTESTVAAMESCILSRTGRAFSLPDRQVTLCTYADDMERSIDCLLRSFMIQRIGSAIEKMSVEDGEAI